MMMVMVKHSVVRCDRAGGGDECITGGVGWSEELVAVAAGGEQTCSEMYLGGGVAETRSQWAHLACGSEAELISRRLFLDRSSFVLDFG